MTNRILVTYASRAGTTAEVAEAIGQALRTPSQPLPSRPGRPGEVIVDVLPMQQVKDLSPYQGVVAGSAIRKSKWLPEAVRFVRAHQSILMHKSFAMFTVCITLAMKNGEQYRPRVAEWVAPIRSLVRPLSEGFFAGKLDFDRLPFNWDTFKLRASVTFGIFPRSDARDWDAICTWAQSLKSILGTMPYPTDFDASQSLHPGESVKIA